jgi:rfaE bifunctional protein nucleotidyltransferase chain/domain
LVIPLTNHLFLPFATYFAVNSLNFLNKIVARDSLPESLKRLRALGPVVFTNGVFDVLHKGHVTYLAQAREEGASLVLGLNSDRSAARLGKGPDRPLNKQDDRATVLAALESVSLVTYFDEDTPLELIQLIRPDILVKGGDYDMEKLKEAQFVRSYGGAAKALTFVTGYSTTQLVQKIRAF